MTTPKQVPLSIADSGYSFCDPFPLPYKQLLHQPILSCQPIFVPSNNNQLFLQMPQIFPLITTDGPQMQVSTISSSLIVQPTFNQLSNVPVSVNPTQHPTTVNKLSNRHKTLNDNNNQLNKTLKKKKASPSAKRRSRLRLMAFLEAKKSASQVEESTLPSTSQNIKTIKDVDGDVATIENSESSGLLSTDLHKQSENAYIENTN